jgi:hypothetical protein
MISVVNTIEYKTVYVVNTIEHKIISWEHNRT